MQQDPQITKQQQSQRSTDSKSRLHGKSSFSVCGIRFDVDKKYRLIKPIGHGAYGVVCSAENVATRSKVAIKKVTKAFTNAIETKRTLREIRLLRQFNHSNILQVYDIMRPNSYESFDDIYIVSELMNTDLHQIVVSPQHLSEEHVQYFLYQTLRGLKYMHSSGVLHRDLKPSNLLLNANCDLKICDFGLARHADPSDSDQGFLTEYVATRWYRAPEIMLSWKRYTKAIDVWSVGCILAELLGRKPLFPGRNYMHQLHLIIDILGTPKRSDTDYIASSKAKTYIRSLPVKQGVPFKKLFPNASPQALDLLRGMLSFSPEKRLTVDQCLAHPYLALLHDVDDEPTCNFKVDFSFENYKLNAENLKSILFDEVCEFHPELRGLKPSTAPTRDQMEREALQRKQAESKSNQDQRRQRILNEAVNNQMAMDMSED